MRLTSLVLLVALTKVVCANLKHKVRNGRKNKREKSKKNVEDAFYCLALLPSFSTCSVACWPAGSAAFTDPCEKVANASFSQDSHGQSLLRLKERKNTPEYLTIFRG